jgi:hypothetical protein
MTCARFVRRSVTVAACVAALHAVSVSAAPERRIVADPEPVILFGPQQYTRQAGPPNVFTATFDNCGTGPGTLIVVNGKADGSNRISSASIRLNGTEVVGPSEFNPHVDRIEKPVSLGAENTLEVRLTSRPGSYVTITIEGAAGARDARGPRTGRQCADAEHADERSPDRQRGRGSRHQRPSHVDRIARRCAHDALPIGLGTIAPEGSAILQASFTGGPFLPGSTWVETIAGTFVVAGATFCFETEVTLVVPPPIDGSGPLRIATIPPLTITGAPFPPLPPDFDEDETNPAGWTVPDGPFQPGVPTRTNGCASGAAQDRARYRGRSRSRLHDQPQRRHHERQYDGGTERWQHRRQRRVRDFQLVGGVLDQQWRHLHAARSDNRFPGRRRRILLRPGRSVRAQHRPLHLVPAGQWVPACGREPATDHQQQRHVVDVLESDSTSVRPACGNRVRLPRSLGGRQQLVHELGRGRRVSRRLHVGLPGGADVAHRIAGRRHHHRGVHGFPPTARCAGEVT